MLRITAALLCLRLEFWEHRDAGRRKPHAELRLLKAAHMQLDRKVYCMHTPPSCVSAGGV